MGSECLGFDDALSRDHDWGPGFCLWLDTTDYARFGRELQKAYESLPPTFKGISRTASQWGRGRVGVMEIGLFYRSLIGLPGAPLLSSEWLVVPEDRLAVCAGGRVFVDPVGKFSAIRATIKRYYPEDVRLKKIAARCMSAAQSGQYNYRRCRKRKDPYGAAHALAQFCEDVLALTFLLNRQYMPFFKWRSRAAVRLPLLGREIAGQIAMLCGDMASEAKEDVIEEVCFSLIAELKHQGVAQDGGWSLLECGPAVFSQITDKELKQLDIWYGGN